jgi:hypothetical protein
VILGDRVELSAMTYREPFYRFPARSNANLASGFVERGSQRMLGRNVQGQVSKKAFAIVHI